MFTSVPIPQERCNWTDGGLEKRNESQEWPRVGCQDKGHTQQMRILAKKILGCNSWIKILKLPEHMERTRTYLLAEHWNVSHSKNIYL
jgi:hypothetical protein